MADSNSTRVYTASTDLTGESFGRWTVLNEAAVRKGRRYWNCRCECGNKRVVDGKELRLGRSNGCTSCRNLKHGQSKPGKCPEYYTWKGIRSRCYNPNHKNADRYGERSICVCDRWMASFENFLSDMGPKPFPEATIERIDNDGNYEPGNCEWATRETQARNTSRNRFLTHDGRTQSLPDWADEVGISQSAIHSRLKRGWTVEETLTTPVIKGRRKDNRFLTFDGDTLTVAGWARKTGIAEGTLRDRLNNKWNVERVLTTPVKQSAKLN